jgi:hypothetical protein
MFVLPSAPPLAAPIESRDAGDKRATGLSHDAAVALLNADRAGDRPMCPFR